MITNFLIYDWIFFCNEINEFMQNVNYTNDNKTVLSYCETIINDPHAAYHEKIKLAKVLSSINLYSYDLLKFILH